MSDPKSAQSYKHPTSSALYGVTVIQALLGYMGWSMFHNIYTFDWINTLIAYSALIYLVLGIAARLLPLTAALTGTGLYLAFLAWQTQRDSNLLSTGLIFKIPVMLLLGIAVKSALMERKSIEVADGKE